MSAPHTKPLPNISRKYHVFVFPNLGTPNEKIWPGYNKLPAPQKMKFIEYPYATLRQKFPVNMLTETGMDLMKKFLTYDPKQRITCDEVNNST